jgi:hypothetical protein
MGVYRHRAAEPNHSHHQQSSPPSILSEPLSGTLVLRSDPDYPLGEQQTRLPFGCTLYMWVFPRSVNHTLSIRYIATIRHVPDHLPETTTDSGLSYVEPLQIVVLPFRLCNPRTDGTLSVSVGTIHVPTSHRIPLERPSCLLPILYIVQNSRPLLAYPMRF